MSAFNRDWWNERPWYREPGVWLVILGCAVLLLCMLEIRRANPTHIVGHVTADGCQKGEK